MAAASPSPPLRRTTTSLAGRQRTQETEREREGAPLGSAVAAELALRLLLPVAIPRPHELPLRSRSNGDSRRGGRLRGESPAMTAVAAVTGVAAAAAVTRLALVA